MLLARIAISLTHALLEGYMALFIASQSEARRRPQYAKEVLHADVLKLEEGSTIDLLMTVDFVAVYPGEMTITIRPKSAFELQQCQICDQSATLSDDSVDTLTLVVPIAYLQFHPVISPGTVGPIFKVKDNAIAASSSAVASAHFVARDEATGESTSATSVFLIEPKPQGTAPRIEVDSTSGSASTMTATLTTGQDILAMIRVRDEDRASRNILVVTLPPDGSAARGTVCVGCSASRNVVSGSLAGYSEFLVSLGSSFLGDSDEMNLADVGPVTLGLGEGATSASVYVQVADADFRSKLFSDRLSVTLVSGGTSDGGSTGGSGGEEPEGESPGTEMPGDGSSSEGEDAGGCGTFCDENAVSFSLLFDTSADDNLEVRKITLVDGVCWPPAPQGCRCSAIIGC